MTVGWQGISERHAVSHAVTIDENDDMLAQVALLIKDVAAQAGIGGEGFVERCAYRWRLRLELRYLGKAPELLGENEICHRLLQVK